MKLNNSYTKLFYPIASAIKNGYIASGMSELVKAGADEETVKLFLSAVENAIKNGHSDYVGGIASGMKKMQLTIESGIM